MKDCYYSRATKETPKLNLKLNNKNATQFENSYDKRTSGQDYDNKTASSFNQKDSRKSEPTDTPESSSNLAEKSLTTSGFIELRDAATLSKQESRIDSVYILPKVKFVNLNGHEIPVLDENLFKVPDCHKPARLPSGKTESKVLTEV